MNKVTVSKPGKLYLAGEYAVVSGQPALLMNTQKKLHVTIEEADNYTYLNEPFTISGSGQTNLDKPYVKEAIELAHHYLLLSKVTLISYKVTTHSELDIPGFPKLGLGTSGAITVALIEAILTFHQVKITPYELYKLSVLAQFKTYPNSSYGDLACASFDQWIYYVPFDRTFLQSLLDKDLITLIKTPWKDLLIEPFKSVNLPLMVIYTNEPADSLTLVKSMQTFEKASFYQEFLLKSKNLVQAFKSSIEESNIENLYGLVKQYNDVFKDLASKTQIALFTDTMYAIEHVIKKHNGVTKFSGAGGGDSMIALFKNNEDKERAYHSLMQQYLILNDTIEGLD